MKKQDSPKAVPVPPAYHAMPIVHQQVAGIDIGARFHVVAVGDNSQTDVKEFGVSTQELFELAQFLTEHSVQHVAMEATGGYEKPLVSVLQEAGFTVLITAGANTKNYRRFKSDVSDAIHIRTAPAARPAPLRTAAAHFHHRRVCYIYPAPSADASYPD